MGRGRFLLALEHVLEVDRKAAAGRQDGGRGHDVGVGLALVVGRAAGEHPTADDDRLEGRRRPQVQRIDRLDVVMAVDQDRRRSGRVEPVRIDDRMAAGLVRSACSRPAASSASASQSAARRQSSRWSGSAEMLGMRRKSLYEASRSAAVRSR